MDDTQNVRTLERRVADLENLVGTLYELWQEDGAEWGDRLSEAAGALAVAQQELAAAR